MSRAGFERLDSMITREYEHRGYSAARAEAIGRATAGKVANIRHKRYGVPAEVREQRKCIKSRMHGRTFDTRHEANTAFREAVEDCAELARKRRARAR